MRIACLNQDPGISPHRQKGGAVHLLAIRRALAERGAEVIAIDTPEEDVALAELAQARESGGVDLIYERFSLKSGAGAAFARVHDVPFVVELNSPLSEESQRWRGGTVDEELLARETRVLSCADLVLAVSSQVAEYARARGALPRAVEIVPNGVDVARFRPRAPGDPLRAELVPEGRFALGFHGRIRAWHGIELLVETTRELLERGAAVQLVVVGEGTLDSEGLPSDHVTRVPWVEHDEVGRYVAAFDVLPLTHPADQPFYFSPLKLAEAMACGVVPIVPALGDLPARVRHGHDAIVVRPGQRDDCVQSIQRLIEDPGARASLAANAVESARGWGWDRVADRILRSVHARSTGR